MHQNVNIILILNSVVQIFMKIGLLSKIVKKQQHVTHNIN